MRRATIQAASRLFKPRAQHATPFSRRMSTQKEDAKSSPGINGAVKAIGGILGLSFVAGGAYYAFSANQEGDAAAIEDMNRAVDAPGFHRKQPRVDQIEALLVGQQDIKTINFQGVTEIQSAWMNSNEPMEDRHSAFTLGPQGIFVGMFDGHSGIETSSVASVYLSGYVARQLTRLSATASIGEIADSFKQSFLEFDHDLTDTVPEAAIKTQNPQIINDFCRPALAGAVSVCALVHPSGIYVANTGDCRAVLGIETKSGIAALPLSFDHTADTPSEVHRIKSEHPGEEETCVMRGRVLGGLQPSRAFGDSSYKWSKERLTSINARVPKRSQTPPYVTAEPEVMYHKHSKDNKFLILATDGLWDVVSSELAVKRVAQALQSGASPMSAAAKLVKQALENYAADGFNSVEHLLSVKAPKSRSYRDDITCTVVMLDVADKPPIDPAEAKVSAAAMDASKLMVPLPSPPKESLMDVFRRATAPPAPPAA